MTGVWRDRLAAGWARALALRARPRLMAALCGLLLGFAQPPFGFLPGLFAYGVLLWLLEGEMGPMPRRRAFAIGWIAGFFYFLVSCYWVAEAFLVFADTYGWMAPFAALLLPAGIALFWGAFAVCYRQFAPRGAKRFLFFAVLFCLFEFVRGSILSGFPWNPAGSTWRAGDAMSQVASWAGVYGLSFITVAIFASIAVLRRGGGWKGYAPAIAAAAVLVLCMAGGEIRLLTTPVGYSDYVIRVVQPAVGQKEKWSRGAFEGLFGDYVSMTRAAPAAGHKRPDLVIWPEGALEYSVEDLFADDSWTAPVLATLLQDNQTLIQGVTRRDRDAEGREVWRNSLMVMHQEHNQAVIEGFADKFKLVPLGEIMPFQMLARRIGFKALTHFDDNFTPGHRIKAVSFASIPRVLPMICYEGIFPALDMTNYRSSNDPLRPKWIVNISNDAWFGPTSGPLQHLNLASYRAIEEGIPMVRSTPTGVTGLIDPLGRVVAGTQLGINHRGYRDFNLPLPGKITPFARFHDANVIIMALFCFILMAMDTLVGVVKKNAVRAHPPH